jgi:hypothetical protein
MVRGGSWLIMFLFIVYGAYAQVQHIPGGRDDTEVALQYLNWVQQVIDEGRWNDAAAALVRVSDFENVSSDISYLQAITNNHFRADRIIIANNLENAIETNRWVIYNENYALVLKAEMLIAMREYYNALAYLNRIGERGEAASSAQMRADMAILRLLALRGIGNTLALEQFRSQILIAMDRFPRDPRPLRIFFEYANNRQPELSDLPQSDINLLEQILRRLPFLLETDPELAWMAAPFMRDIDAARRLVASYRAGGIPHIRNRDFRPHPGSIPVALNLGVIGDFEAAQELFSGSRGFNNPLPPEFVPDGNPVLDKRIIIDTYNLLRSEEGRNFFTQRLLSFTGTIFADDDNDGYIDSHVYYNSGIIQGFAFDRLQNNIFDLQISMVDGVPSNARVRLSGQFIFANINWERYPAVEQITLGNEIFRFGPADFQYAPVSFIELGGCAALSGILFPVPAHQYIDLTYRTLLSFCSSLSRPSTEIDGAIETIYMNRGVALQAVETLNGRQVSVTEFERGLPVIQYIDLDLDGRMETIRRFRTPGTQQDYAWQDSLDYRRLIASSESDWVGNGRHMTREVYLEDGSIVYYFDMEGTGQWTYVETRNQ